MATPSANASSALVHVSADALRRLSGAPATAQAARAAAEEIESAWSRAPLSAGLAGDLIARTAFLDYLAGARLFQPVGRGDSAAVVRVRRGDETRFRIILRDGSQQEMALSGPRSASLRARAGELRARQDEIRAELSARESALERAQLAVPGPLRRRPPLWAFWAWLARWVLGLVARKRLAAEASASEQVGYVRSELSSVEAELEQVSQDAQAADATFVNRLRAAAAGGDGRVASVELTVVGGPLPEGVEVVDPGRPGDTDALLQLAGEEVSLAPGAGDAAPRRLGGFAQAVAALPVLLASERALALGRRARHRIVVGADTLEKAIERAEAGFQARLDRLEALRLSEREPFVAAQLERMRPLVTERVTMTLEQATVHLGMEVERLGADWARAISQAESSDALRAAAGAIDGGSPAAIKELAKEVRLLVAIGLNGATHDLLPDLVAELIKRGLPAQIANPPRLELPAPAAVEVCPSLAAGHTERVLGSAQWLSALFRSLDARRSDALERIEQRRHRLRDIAMAELLNSQPQLAAALSEALRLALADALDRYDQWLAAALAGEEEAISREREALSPMLQVREGARRDDRRLADLMAQLEAELPALAG